MAIGIAHPQHQDSDRHHEEGEERTGIGNVRQLAHRQERCANRDENAGDDGHDMRSFEARMDARQLFRQQPVARHHEEDTCLAEHHHQDDGRKSEIGG